MQSFRISVPRWWLSLIRHRNSSCFYMYHHSHLQVPPSRTRRWPQHQCTPQMPLLISACSTINWGRALRVVRARINQRPSSWSRLGQQACHVAHSQTCLSLASQCHHGMPLRRTLVSLVMAVRTLLEETTLPLKAEPLRRRLVSLRLPFFLLRALAFLPEASEW